MQETQYSGWPTSRNGLTNSRNIGLYSITLPVAVIRELVLVLDPSESAIQESASMLAYAQDFLRALSSHFRPRICLLGGRTDSFPVEELARMGGQWLSAQRKRLSIVGPLFEELTSSASSCPEIVILGAGLLYDLEDWQEQPLFEMNTDVPWLLGAIAAEFERDRQGTGRKVHVLHWM